MSLLMMTRKLLDYKGDFCLSLSSVRWSVTCLPLFNEISRCSASCKGVILWLSLVYLACTLCCFSFKPWVTFVAFHMCHQLVRTLNAAWLSARACCFHALSIFALNIISSIEYWKCRCFLYYIKNWVVYMWIILFVVFSWFQEKEG